MDLVQQLLIALFLIAALLAGLWAMKRKGLASFRVGSLPPSLSRGRGPRKLEMVERLQLSPTHALCLVRFEQRSLLVSTGPSGCALLESRAVPETHGFAEEVR